MPQRIVHANGVDLCVETFGSPGDPAILLLAGMSSSMLVWEDEFCARLAADSRYVIRFDYGDTGRSVGYPPGAPGYGGLDLAVDALALLGVFKAHFVGISMGGGLAQLLAADDRRAARLLHERADAGLVKPRVDGRLLGRA